MVVSWRYALVDLQRVCVSVRRGCRRLASMGQLPVLDVAIFRCKVANLRGHMAHMSESTTGRCGRPERVPLQHSRTCQAEKNNARGTESRDVQKQYPTHT